MKLFINLSIFVIILFTVMQTSAVAGGSFATSEVLPLLKQKMDLYRLVMKTLDLDGSGWATRIGGNINSDLGGSRIAPYAIKAKPKGSKGPWQYYLSIEAETIFYDEAGKKVALYQGKTIKENLTGISLEIIPESERK